jgi:hypothetical protein
MSSAAEWDSSRNEYHKLESASQGIRTIGPRYGELDGSWGPLQLHNASYLWNTGCLRRPQERPRMSLPVSRKALAQQGSLQ